MNPKDWTLLVIASADRQAIQPVQLQKSLFLIAKNVPPQILGPQPFYNFSPYDYGPFCSSVYNDAEQLEMEGLVTIHRPPQSRYKSYIATDSGSLKAQTCLQRLPAEIADYVKKVVSFSQRLSFNELVGAIYKAYPDMRVNSVFKDCSL